LKPKILTLRRLLLPYGMGAAINHPVPDRLKPLFVIFDIWALWHSGLKEKGLRPFELFASVDDDGSLLRHSWYRWWVYMYVCMCVYVCLGSRRNLWVNQATFTSPAVRLCTRAVMLYRVILLIQLSIRHRMCLVLRDIEQLQRFCIVWCDGFNCGSCSLPSVNQPCVCVSLASVHTVCSR